MPRTGSGANFLTSYHGKWKKHVTDLGWAHDHALWRYWHGVTHQTIIVHQWAGVRFPPLLPSFFFWKSTLPAQLCFIVHFVFPASNSRVPQEAVTAGFLDEVHWPFRSVSHICRQDDEAVGYQFCHHCEWGVSRTCRNRYQLLQKNCVGHQNGEQLCTGLYSTCIALFSNPLEVCLATAPRSHLKTNTTTLETVLAQNNQRRIGKKGEVSRRKNTVLRFMS